MNIRDANFLQEFKDNWVILVLGFACTLFAFSAPAFSLPFLYGSVIDEFGWTREQATLLSTYKYFTGAVAALVVGRFIDVIGVRSALAAVSILGGIALISFLWVPNLQIYYAIGVLLGIATPGTIVAIKILISRTFHASQGTAMGLALLGMAFGQMIVPFAITFLMDSFGWRLGVALMSTGIWLILPFIILYGRKAMVEQLGPQHLTEKPEKGATRAFLANITRQPAFWLITCGVFSAAFVDQAFIQHQVLYLRTDLGIDPTVVAAGISAMGLIGIAARVLIGGLVDKVSAVKGISLMYSTLFFASLLALAAGNPIIFMAFVVLRAVGHSAVLLDTAVLTKHVFGVKNIGLLLGIFTAVVNLGFATGPWFVSVLYESTGSYTLPFIICAGITIFAALVLLPIKPAAWLAIKQAAAK